MKKGFTLIELLAVIVVLAILALVVTPIVLNIVENAQTGSDERSLEQYAKLVQSTYYELKIKDPSLTLEEYLNKIDTEDGIKLTYNGSKVVCSERKVVETVSGTKTIELRNCMVDGRGPYDFINGSAGNKNVSSTKSFSADSWSTIIANVKNGNTSSYKVGDTKTVTLTSTDTNIAGTYKVRIANMSTPEECSTKGFSQTACGFVIEFVDIIITGGLSNVSANGNGWPGTFMRSYVNSNIYNALPSELKSGIITTYTVSGQGRYDSKNNISTDKLYLLSTKEVWGELFQYDSAGDETRQLDYYKELGVTTKNYSGAIKQYKSWWLRSANYIDQASFYYVSTSGNWSSTYSQIIHGVSPAFRIG